MTVAIISDSHDNIPNLKKALDFCQKNNINTIIHCGDLSRPSTLKQALSPKSCLQIHFVFGNADQLEIFNKEQIPQLKIYNQIGDINLKNKKIAFTHYPGEAKMLAKTQKYDYVFYGHTHKPWEQTIEKTKLVNPGNLANMFYKPSFAILDLEKNKLELKILEMI